MCTTRCKRFAALTPREFLSGCRCKAGIAGIYYRSLRYENIIFCNQCEEEGAYSAELPPFVKIRPAAAGRAVAAPAHALAEVNAWPNFRGEHAVNPIQLAPPPAAAVASAVKDQLQAAQQALCLPPAPSLATDHRPPPVLSRKGYTHVQRQTVPDDGTVPSWIAIEAPGLRNVTRPVLMLMVAGKSKPLVIAGSECREIAMKCATKKAVTPADAKGLTKHAALEGTMSRSPASGCCASQRYKCHHRRELFCKFEVLVTVTYDRSTCTWYIDTYTKGEHEHPWERDETYRAWVSVQQQQQQ